MARVREGSHRRRSFLAGGSHCGKVTMVAPVWLDTIAPTAIAQSDISEWIYSEFFTLDSRILPARRASMSQERWAIGCDAGVWSCYTELYL